MKTIKNLEKQNSEILRDWNKVNDELESLKKEYAIYKIATHLERNGVDVKLSKILATDAYKEARGDLIWA
jgi:hypothetical protein